MRFDAMQMDNPGALSGVKKRKGMPGTTISKNRSHQPTWPRIRFDPEFTKSTLEMVSNFEI